MVQGAVKDATDQAIETGKKATEDVIDTIFDIFGRPVRKIPKGE